MPTILKPSDVAKRLLAGESENDIFLDAGGGYQAKLVGPQADVVIASETDRSVDFVISTEAVDRYTDIVNLGGWKTQNFTRSPVVLWAHDDSIPAIARATNVRVEGKALRSMAIFAEKDVYPLADTIYQLVKGKFLNAASVGFIPLKAKGASGKDRPFGLDIIEQELLEWSVVNIPANPECLVQARSIGIDTVPLIGWAERVLDKGGMLLIPRAELEQLRKSAGAPTMVGATSFSDEQITKIATETAQRAFKAAVATATAGGEKPAAGDGTAAQRKIKKLRHVAWLASILDDLDMLEDCVEFEAEMEGDGSEVPGQLTDALHALGAALVAMTVEEVAELLGDESGAEVTPPADPVTASRMALRMSLLQKLAKASDADIQTALGVVKAGKVLSAANTKALTDAHGAITKGCEIIKSVMDAAQPAADAADDNDDDTAAKAAGVIAIRKRRARAKLRKTKLSAPAA